MFIKLSLKIGCLFFVFILLIESLLFYTLYITLVNDKVEDVMQSLLERGETHSAVLADRFTKETIEHVRMMEAASSFIVVVTDASGSVLIQSDTVDAEIKTVMHSTNFSSAPAGGRVVETNWNNRNYIASDSPVIKNGQHLGHVFMFSRTEEIAQMIKKMQRQFYAIGFVAAALTIITILWLSRLVTRPLLQMKQATEQLSLGRHEVHLMIDRNDELGELAASITKLSKDLQQLKKTRHEFLGSISHELRTPLTYIKGYSDILSRPGLAEQEKQMYLAIIQEETARLASFIQKLFELAKMDQHEFRIFKQIESVDNLLESVVQLVGPAFQKEGKTLIIEGTKNLQAMMDRERMQQVLLNLLDNARKYSDTGSRVLLVALKQNDAVIIQVQDEGIGIPQKDVPFLFERLYRVEKSRSRKSGGSGIGLSIAKEIVEAHEGKITITSEEGAGTTATIQLACKEETYA